MAVWTPWQGIIRRIWQARGAWRPLQIARKAAVDQLRRLSRTDGHLKADLAKKKNGLIAPQNATIVTGGRTYYRAILSGEQRPPPEPARPPRHMFDTFRPVIFPIAVSVPKRLSGA